MNRDEFHRLLRTEFSTVDIYHRVIRNLDWKEIEKNANVRHLFNMLVDNLQDHLAAASELKAEIQQMGITPPHGLAASGGSPQLAVEAPNMREDKTAIEILKQREIGCLENYEDTLRDTETPSDIETLLKKLAAKQRWRINALNEFMT